MNKEQFNRILLAGVILWLVLIAFQGVVKAIRGPIEGPESAYSKVMASGTLRCGYVLYPPAVVKDPNTGEFSGIAYEVMQKIGERLALNIEWVEEVTFATNVEGLRSNRYDAVCITYWMNPNEGKYVNFSIPFYYSALVPAFKVDDAQKPFDLSGLADIKEENIKIAAVDGSVAMRVAQSKYPKMQILSLPNTTSVSELLMNVADGKADAAFVEPFQLAEWNANNADKKLDDGNEILSVFPNVIALAPNDAPLKTMIDAALTDLLNSGEIDTILTKYEKHPGSFYRVAKPYQADKQ